MGGEESGGRMGTGEGRGVTMRNETRPYASRGCGQAASAKGRKGALRRA